MKKRQILFIFIPFLSCYLNAQTNFDLYGVCFVRNSMDEYRAFSKIDPDNGNLTILNKWSRQNIYAFGTNTVDPKNKMYYQMTTDSLNMYVLKIDLNTGTVLDTVFTQDSLGTGESGYNWISNEITGLFYNCVDDHIYFLYHTKNKNLNTSNSTGETYIAKVHAITGKASLVATLPVFLNSNQQYCNSVHQRIFLDCPLEKGRIYVYNLQTASLSSFNLSKNYAPNQYVDFVLNPSDNYLYGIESDYTFFTFPNYMAKCRMIKINPANGKVTDLSAPFDFNGSGTLSFEPANKKLYFIGQLTNPGHEHMFSLDIETKTIQHYSTNNIPQASLWLGIHSVGNAPPDTAFTYKNFCQNAPTYFSPETRYGSIEWNFGDPGSGSLNTSTQPDPQHVYTQPGTYTVTMISSTCWGADTTTKNVVIQAFPKINLGNDTSWCINRKQNELLLDVTAPGIIYLWQDASTASTYTANQPGIYWVKASGSCGTVTDSLVIKSITCPCDILVGPTLTSHSVFFNFDCEFSSYNSPTIEVYNETGQIVLRSYLQEDNTEIRLDAFSAGIYFYRIYQSTTLLKNGKIIFIH